MAENLLALAQELQIQILSRLDAVSLIHCAMTCKHLHEALQSSSQLLYIIQLHLEGLKDQGTSTPHSELIQHLQNHREAWSSLTPDKEIGYVPLDLQHACRAYKIVGGVFANTNKQDLEIVWLPTFGDGKTRTLQRAFTETPIREFTMDPTQDLLVFLEDGPTPSSSIVSRTVRVHIRTMSTNVIHPLAHQSPLQFTTPPDPVHGNRIQKAVLQLAGSTLALYFCALSGPPQMFIWDWTTSHLLADFSKPFNPTLLLARYNFGLLDASHCFVTSVTASGLIRLYKLIRPPSATSTPIHLATLHLPPTYPGTYISSITAHAGPIEAKPLPHTPFMVNDEDRLHVFTVEYYLDDGNDNNNDNYNDNDSDDSYDFNDNGSAHSASLNIFVHQRVLTKYCSQNTLRRHADGTAPPLDIPWAEWGPPNTHLASPAVTPSDWLGYVHGQRVICQLQSSTEPEDTYGCIRVLDFSRAAVFLAKNIDTVRDDSKDLVQSSEIKERQAPFLLNARSSLPYVSSTLQCQSHYLAYMIYRDGFIGVDMHLDYNLSFDVYTALQEQTNPESLVFPHCY